MAMSLFGQPSTSNQPAGGGLFGSTNTASQPSGGLFGSTNTNTQPSGGGLFGSNTANTTQPASGGLFGNAQNQTQNTTGGGLFGASTTNTNTNTANSNPLFGGKPAGSLFGATAANANTGATGGGGLFGSTTGQQNQGNSLFGGGTGANQQQPAQSGGLFGNTNTNTNQQQGASGGLFGSTNANTNANAGGLFGSKPAGGLFGSAQQAGTSTGSGGLFGGGQTQPSGSLFGQSTNNSNPMFGGQSTSNALFGGQQQNQSIAPAQSLLMSRATQAQAPPANDPQSQFLRLQGRIEEISNSWNPQSPQCRFQHYFYNLVLPEQVAMYGRPSNATNDAAWQEAVRRNPDPSRLVPVPANGFGDLRARVEGQTKHAADHQEKIKDLQSRIAKLRNAHELENHTKLQRAAAMQMQVTHRLLKFVARLYLLIPSVRQSTLLPEEEQLRAVLEEIGEDLSRGQGGGRMRAKLNELWALVGVLSAARERQVTGAGEWAVVDEEGLARIGQILADQQSGLAHITKVLKKAQRDIAVILGQRPTDLDDVDGEELWGSAAGALRASTLR
ncbi:nucleoporin complex subunit 54-domain-containing protein [Schizophyllum amplum]|uniref:Nucleoporin complex subunit 54-domain-containing protein n=1 Tax=Schizophyllum amplum TaxID=97359 RepID=A0A550CQJ1_9AGAR|nr:nucleoporin complex subunit 54-domain-containing protein [Auriculariopsis ampla]